MRETIMEQRINDGKAAPEGIRALGGLETYLRGSGLEPCLLNLIKTRASQLNGCAYCLDMHTKDARAGGETEQRLYAFRRGARLPSTPRQWGSHGRECRHDPTEASL